MAARRQTSERVSGLLVVVLTIVAAFGVLFPASEATTAMQAESEEVSSSLRVIHGIANAGPLDVYVDGSLALIGLVFPDVSGDLLLAGGEHQFAVVPSGATLDQAIAAGTIALEAGTPSYAALFGTQEDTSVGLFAVDDRPLDAGRARFRVISGAVDAGEIVPLFTGGDAISQPLGYGDASEYAAIDAGIYDLDIIDATAGVSLLTLPQTPLAEGVATDIVVVGALGDGTLQAVIATAPTGVLETAPASGQLAQIVAGTCAAPGSPVADLGAVQPGVSEAVGVAGVPPVVQGYALAGVAFDTLIAAPHAVSVAAGETAALAVIACGEIGGRLTETGALVIALRETGMGAPAGIAVLAPGLVDVETTGVSVFLTVGEAPDANAATPVAVSG
jgi:hypothetical protein